MEITRVNCIDTRFTQCYNTFLPSVIGDWKSLPCVNRYANTMDLVIMIAFVPKDVAVKTTFLLLKKILKRSRMICKKRLVLFFPDRAYPKHTFLKN